MASAPDRTNENLQTSIFVLERHNYPTETETVVKLWYHTDRLGTVDFMTNNINGRVEFFASYDSWGALEGNAVLRMGVRQLNFVSYTGFMYDQVLGLYFAQARMYCPATRRFLAVDPIRGNVFDAHSMNAYLYVLNNPLRWVDPLGLSPRNPNEVGLRDFAEAAGATVGWCDDTRQASVTMGDRTDFFDIYAHTVIEGRIQIDPAELSWLFGSLGGAFNAGLSELDNFTDEDWINYAKREGIITSGGVSYDILMDLRRHPEMMANFRHQMRQETVIELARNLNNIANPPAVPEHIRMMQEMSDDIAQHLALLHSQMPLYMRYNDILPGFITGQPAQIYTIHSAPTFWSDVIYAVAQSISLDVSIGFGIGTAMTIGPIGYEAILNVSTFSRTIDVDGIGPTYHSIGIGVQVNFTDHVAFGLGAGLEAPWVEGQGLLQSPDLRGTYIVGLVLSDFVPIGITTGFSNVEANADLIVSVGVEKYLLIGGGIRVSFNVSEFNRIMRGE